MRKFMALKSSNSNRTPKIEPFSACTYFFFFYAAWSYQRKPFLKFLSPKYSGFNSIHTLSFICYHLPNFSTQWAFHRLFRTLNRCPNFFARLHSYTQPSLPGLDHAASPNWHLLAHNLRQIRWALPQFFSWYHSFFWSIDSSCHRLRVHRMFCTFVSSIKSYPTCCWRWIWTSCPGPQLW